MVPFTKVLHDKLEEHLKQLLIDENNSLKQKEAGIQIIRLHIDTLRDFIINYKFKSIAEEIKFFKEIKPLFFSKLIFYIKSFNIETKRPSASDSSQKRYYEDELNDLQRFFDDNLEFYQYYRMEATDLDEKYFRRGKFDIRLNLDTLFYEPDLRFSSSHDSRVSKIIANKLLAEHLKTEISLLDRKEYFTYKSQTMSGEKLNWSDSKTSLVELIYALHSSGAFEAGNADIREIASLFEILFDIDLGDFYRTWLEIKERKSSRTKFLDLLKANLVKRMDESEE